MNAEIIRIVPGNDFLRHKHWSLNQSSKIVAGGDDGDILPVMIAKGALKNDVISDAVKLSLAGSEIVVRGSSVAKSKATLVAVYGLEPLFATEGFTLGSYMSVMTWSYRFAGKTSAFAVFVRIMSPGESLPLFVEGAPFSVKNIGERQVIAGFVR